MLLSIQQLMINRQSADSSFKVCLPELNLAAGEIVILQGDSGCGKSTLLEMIGLILQPDSVLSYQVKFGHETLDLAALIEYQMQDKLSAIRAEHVGFMLQTGGLLPFLTVQQNIALPTALLDRELDLARLMYLAEKLSIGHLLNKFPKQLSIGERQRASFIRAIMHKPALLLADEPTSALDPYNANVLLDLIIEQTQQDRIAAVIVSHDHQLVADQGFTMLAPHMKCNTIAEFRPVVSGGEHA